MAIWEKTQYRSPLPKCFNSTIVEYDMKSANTSLAREFNLLPEKKISELEAMGKKDRVVAIGKIMAGDPDYSAKEKLAFQEARRSFIEMNALEEEDIIAIKRDAIFTLRYVKEENITKNIVFRKKNEYTSYIYLKPLEIFYNPMNGLDIKGIDDEVYKNYHKEYFGDFLYHTIRKVETSEQKDYLQYIRTFWDSYKWRKLPVEYYREFNPQSKFHYLDGQLAAEEYRENKDDLDISFNLEIIMKLLNVLLT